MTQTKAANPRAYFQKWYKQNREDISNKRKAKYQTDPEYRAKALENARKQRERQLAERPELPREYKFSSRQAADAIGCTTNDLRAWRARDHYPLPFIYRGRAYFTDTQVMLLQRLHKFLESNGPRIKATDRDSFENLKTLISVNW